MMLAAFSRKAYATTITASTQNTWVYPATTLDVAVDLTNDIITFVYWGEWLIVAPLPSAGGAVWYKVWDDLGFVHEVMFLSQKRQGTVVLNYTNTNTWLHIEVMWVYFGVCWTVMPSCKINLYIPSGESTETTTYTIEYRWRAGGCSRICLV
jgi:hypothetical protein